MSGMSVLQGNLETRLKRVHKNEDNVSRRFSNFMMNGRVKDALRLLSEDNCGGALSLSSTVLKALSDKHPKGCPPLPTTLISNSSNSVPPPHPIVFEGLDGICIRRAALRTGGTAGPSGLDAAAWRRMCTSFQRVSDDLCEALAGVARRLCTVFVDPSGLTAFVACRLIALDKCPGVRPIGIGETVRRVIAKAILCVIRSDIQRAAGSLQLCAGQLSGCEAAVHSTREIFSSADVDAVLLVDATNAFNSLNRQAALRNIQHLCPPFSTILINTYREDVNLYIGGSVLHSEEGTTQGDPLAMPMYALGVIPLIESLSGSCVQQIWYADDATACGGLKELRSWWNKLTSDGPGFGYFPNPSKTCIIEKSGMYDAAVSAFQGTGISITSDGKRHLGAAIGSPSFITSFVETKVTSWVRELQQLSDISVTHPQAAYAALIHGFIGKWNYLMRCIPNIQPLLSPLEHTIRLKFLPSLTGQPSFSDTDRNLFALPARWGGLGVIDPVRYSLSQFAASVEVTAPLVHLILQQSHTYPVEVLSAKIDARRAVLSAHRQSVIDYRDALMPTLSPSLYRSVVLSSEKGSSGWLTALPILDHGFCLHKGAFRDSLCLRYGWRPLLLPSSCVCGKQFSVEHAFSCPCGGLPTIRHNELRDITAGLLTELCHGVEVEPSLQPLSGESFRLRSANTENGARLDVVANGFWERGQNAYFDVKVFNPFAPTHCSISLSQCYRRAELEKKRKYEERIREVEHGSFLPLIFSCTGGMGPLATVVYK
ncbi:uncharacterized protein [Dysidea avara]|uniref:uncharacterized protein n=1 Tax=Dysidea avara TaxID=196820 RepID=UPI00332FF17F